MYEMYILPMYFMMLFGNLKYALAISCNCKEINIDIETLKLYIDELFPLGKMFQKENEIAGNHANNKINTEVFLKPMIVERYF